MSIMKVEKDFEDFIELLNKYSVNYLIVGAYALALFVEPRNTGDIDIFVERSKENAEKILVVLKEFGFAGLELALKDFITKDMVVQLGFQPVRIDIITSISGVDFDDAFTFREEKQFGKTKAYFISKEFLIKKKSFRKEKRFSRFRASIKKEKK